MSNKSLTTIGRAELVSFPDFGITKVPAKIDTGADVSAIWASDITETSNGLECILFGPGNDLYTGSKITIPKSQYTITRIANSFGQKEIRYKIKLRLLVKDRLIKATFTLSDRSKKTYPILLGRRLLQGKFVVDVSQGEPLAELEKVKRTKLLEELKLSTEREE